MQAERNRRRSLGSYRAWLDANVVSSALGQGCQTTGAALVGYLGNGDESENGT
jgi:hypothetical protein